MEGRLRVGLGGVVLSLTFEVDDRFYAAAEDWADQQLMDAEEALEVKVEQSLLEIEHLISGAREVDFEVDGRAVVHHPTGELEAFLGRQAEVTGLEEATLLKLHVDLFAGAFLEDDGERPPNAPPPD